MVSECKIGMLFVIFVSSTFEQNVGGGEGGGIDPKYMFCVECHIILSDYIIAM